MGLHLQHSIVFSSFKTNKSSWQIIEDDLDGVVDGEDCLSGASVGIFLLSWPAISTESNPTGAILQNRDERNNEPISLEIKPLSSYTMSR